MGLISLTDPVVGTTVTAGLHTGNNAALRTAINGGIDNNNVAVGAAIASSKLAGVMLLGVRIFTASATYTPTTGTNRVYIECIGAGGQGGGTAITGVSQNAAGGGGGGGSYAASYLSAGFSGTAYVVGAGGSTSVAGNNVGQAGADTTFGATVIVAKGGLGGQGSPLNGTATGVLALAGPGNAVGNVGDITVPGGAGAPGISYTLTGPLAGQGGGSSLGFPSNAAYGSTGQGNTGSNYGVGGGGAIALASQAAQKGGLGAPGVIRIWEYV